MKSKYVAVFAVITDCPPAYIGQANRTFQSLSYQTKCLLSCHAASPCIQETTATEFHRAYYPCQHNNSHPWCRLFQKRKRWGSSAAFNKRDIPPFCGLLSFSHCKEPLGQRAGCVFRHGAGCYCVLGTKAAWKQEKPITQERALCEWDGDEVWWNLTMHRCIDFRFSENLLLFFLCQS